jgi:RimJ/RimL family protein N-acetyltransferase
VQPDDKAVSIETARLILRTVTPADVEGVASSWKLDQGPISPAEAQRVIDKMRANHAQNRPGKILHLCLAILSKETGAFIGWCGLDHTDPRDADPALFYLLKASCWGKGLATEAAGAVLDYAFRQLALASVHGGAAPENLASKRVMEKIGMRDIGLDDEGGYAFTISREAFLINDL